MLERATKYAMLAVFTLLIIAFIFAVLDVNISPYGGIFGLIIIVSSLVMIVLMLIGFVSEIAHNKSLFTAKFFLKLIFESAAVAFCFFIALYWFRGEKEYFISALLGITLAISMIKLYINKNAK